MVVMQPNVLVRSTIRAQEMYLQDTHGTRQCTCEIHKAPCNLLTSKIHKAPANVLTRYTRHQAMYL